MPKETQQLKHKVQGVLHQKEKNGFACLLKIKTYQLQRKTLQF